MSELNNAQTTRDAPTPTAETDAALQQALAQAVSAFGKRVREHGVIPAYASDGEVAPADAAFTAAAILKAAEVNSFEIAALFNV